MLTLFDSAFSPFARKVRMVLSHKGLEHRVVDGLDVANHAALQAVNQRIEVPVLVHDGTTVVNSADIIAYLERVFPERSVYPANAAEWVRARDWERCADTLVDAIMTDISYWGWAERDDQPPDGLREAAQRDLDQVYQALERDLADRAFLCGSEPSIAEFALFPHLLAVRMLGVPFTHERFPGMHRWMRSLRALPVFAADVERITNFLKAGFAGSGYERRKLFWRGDRIEWLLARGYHRWFVAEIEADRVLWPGLTIPGARNAG